MVNRLPRGKVSKDKTKFSDDDIVVTRKEFGPTLRGIVLGASPSFIVIENFVKKLWAGHVPKVSALPNSVFQLQFESYEDLQ